MYTLINIHTDIVQDVGVSEDDFNNGNYIDAEFTTKVVNHKSVEYLSWDEVREWRAEELKDSDWRVAIDYPNEDQESWIFYRKRLRDLPQDYLEVADGVVPDKP